ncbi:MAG: hypothetical protein EXR02_03370 [Rhodospirillales bacterium]|nr:hypothetical protein [Rhodospirillales bacterium]MSP80091.1 hypothetical protein [Rhodospirillales bacterium]
MAHLDRKQLIVLLKRLEGPAEKDVLDAAREIAERRAAAGVSWDDLLVASKPDGASAAADPDAGAGDALTPEETAEARSEIAALLALDKISEATAGEIGDLRGDLDAGRFGKGDLRYVRALRARLS